VGANAPSYKRAFATIRNPAAEVPKEIILPAYATVPQDLDGYATQSAKELEGRYVCFRPSFHVSDVIHSYIVLIRWDEERSCLIFEEQSRPDSVHTQKGLVYLPDGKPFLNLVTMDKGSVRLIMVARPVEGIARGIILTLSTPRGTHFTPMAAPVVLRRLGEVTPQLGFVHRNAPDYDLYHMQLASVVPDFGDFALPLFASASTAHPIQPPNPEGARRRRTKASAG
jgi:hypothetical protein